MSDKRVLWRPNSDFQRRFLACSARFAMAGSGIGSGKTSAMLAAAASQTSHPLYRAALFRLDYPSLRHIISTSIPLFAPLGATYNRQEHVWRFRSGAEILFSHLDDELALYQHAGAEYQFLGFDECQQLPGNDTDAKGMPINSAFAYLQTRLRAPKDGGLRLEVRLAGTSWGRGVGWLKAFFKIPDSGEDTDFVDEINGYRRCFFKSTYLDNPALSEDYKRQLFNLPSAQQKALLYGDFSSNVGQVFNFDYHRHTVERFPVPADWDVWRGADDGYAAPACVLWMAHDETHDRIYVIEELYARGLTPEAMAREVLRIDRSIPVNLYGETVSNDAGIDGVIDSASFADVGLGDESGRGGRAEIMNRLHCRWSPSPKGRGSRIAGVSAVHQRLALKPDGYGGLVVFRNCRNLIRTLPQMVYSKTNPEDIDPSCEEHAVKALMYGLTRRKMNSKVMRVRWAH